MSDSEARILEARARFHLLRSVHSLFGLALPTVEDVESGRYGPVSEADLANLVNDVTILRSDIKCLPIKLQQIDIDQVMSDAEIDRLIKAFDSLLGLFEESVLDLETGVDVAMPQDANSVAPYPKLVTLQSLRRQHDLKAVKKDACGTEDHKTSTDEHSTTPDSTALLEKQMPVVRLDGVTSYINFPLPKAAICRDTVESFGKVVSDVFPDAVGLWNVESRLEEVSNAEIEYIRDADAFSKASSSLFQLLVRCITCEAEHVAKLHLSGFCAGQLEMLLGTREHDWIPACFTHSHTAASSERTFKHRMCAHEPAAEYHSRTIRGRFNETAVWEDCVLEPALYDLVTATPSTSRLDHILQGNTQASYRTNARAQRLDRMGREIVGVRLVCSLFRLCGSPWLQHAFDGENIFLLPNKNPVSRLNFHWRPHISCDLSSHSSPRSLSEDVAALGVLILELEANLSAGWTEDDEDYETATKSNKMRLCRILKEWKGDLTDFYKGLGSICFQFEKLVERFDHPTIHRDLRSLAVLYKRILNPLYRKLVSDFGAAEHLFQGISGLSIPTRPKRAEAAGPVLLYDDWESAKRDEKKSKYAEDWMSTLENNFLCKIGTLQQNSGLAERLKGMQKIRIAVLDTGIDLTDKIINPAMSRIIDKRSWVGESFLDNHGHGTHVTRLLLKMAPAAEIFVAKITDDKDIDPENMSRIAEAIDWAVEKNVHIISMSFGFWDQNKAIDEAIERASKADKLMFAAASNEGGNRGGDKGRSRPGRNSKVICIHACDGKGNKGDMSPSPLKKNDNFTTLGVAVKSEWKKQTVYKSGTSFATPVAAAIAADVLEFANFKLSDEDKGRLYKCDGMLAVFRVMSAERDGYDYVHPGRLWDGRGDDRVAETIRDTLAKL